MINFVSVSALNVFEGVLRAQGLDPATANLSTAEKARVATLVSRALAKAWRMTMWPQLLVVKRIEFRDTWDADDSYETDDEVYYAEHYWRSLVDGNSGTTPGTDAAKWTAAEGDMVYSVNFAAHGIDEMDLEAGCFSADPERVRDPKKYALMRTGTGAAVVAADGATMPTRPYIRYRPFPPKYSWAAWAAGTAYTTGDVVYHDGECYMAQASSTGTEPGTDEDKWAPQPVPEMFVDFIEEWCVAQRMQDDDGKAKALRLAEAALLDAHAAFAGQTRTRRRVSVRVC